MTTSLRRAALALALAAAPALAQQPEALEGHQVVSDSFFGSVPAATPDGQRFSVVYAKFAKQFNEFLKLASAPGLHERFLVRDARLRALLNGNRDSNERPLAQRCNVQLIGTGQRVHGVYSLIVTRVVGLESDAEHVRRRVAALPPEDHKARTALAAYVRSRLSRYFTDPDADADEKRELEAAARQLEDEARRIEREQLPPLPGGAETWIEYGRAHKSLDVLAGVADDPSVEPEARARAEQALTGELRAQRHLGRWVPYEEFKAAVGFAQLNGGDRWAPKERVELLQVADAEKQRLRANQDPISVLPESLLRQAKEVVRGMNKDMVYHVLQTYPARVDRLRDQLGSAPVVFEQWVMEDGMRIYFINGLVFQRVDPR